MRFFLYTYLVHCKIYKLKFEPNFFFLFHYTDWGSIATISTREEILGFPFSNVVSFADGIDAETATGTPYFYVTDMEMSQIGMIIFNIFFFLFAFKKYLGRNHL